MPNPMICSPIAFHPLCWFNMDLPPRTFGGAFDDKPLWRVGAAVVTDDNAAPFWAAGLADAGAQGKAVGEGFIHLRSP